MCRCRFGVFMDRDGVLLSKLKTTNLSFFTQVNIVSSHVRSNTQATTHIRRRLVTNIQPVTKLYTGTMRKFHNCTKPLITRNKVKNLNKRAEESEHDIICQFVIKEIRILVLALWNPNFHWSVFNTTTIVLLGLGHYCNLLSTQV